MTENKNNVYYFEGSSMNDLFMALQEWQDENKTRFLSLNVQQDDRKFCCIALTNPSEVVIVAREMKTYDPSSHEYVEISRTRTSLDTC